MRTVHHQPEVVRGYRRRPDRPAPPRPATGPPAADDRSWDDAAPSAWRQRVPGPQVPGLISGVTLMCGIWLVVAPWVWSYGGTGGGFDARWNDVLVGLVVAVAGAARLARRIRLAIATAVGSAAGFWLVVAPFALAYGYGADSTRATFNDVLIGLVLLAITVLGHSSARMMLTARL